MFACVRILVCVCVCVCVCVATQGGLHTLIKSQFAEVWSLAGLPLTHNNEKFLEYSEILLRSGPYRLAPLHIFLSTPTKNNMMH